MMFLYGWHRPRWRCYISVALFRLAHAIGRLGDRIDPTTGHPVADVESAFASLDR